jgi:cytidylate kinase
MIPVITVDGGAACGKGAVAQSLAKALGFHYLDSGVFYRALGYRAILRDINVSTPSANDLQESIDRLLVLAETLRLVFDHDHLFLLESNFTQNSGKTADERINITSAIRTEQVSRMSSLVSQFPAVRSALIHAQQASRLPPGLVAEGRDMGTVVFPDARLKLFLNCDLNERARRRVRQLASQGISANMDEVAKLLAERDHRDTTRTVAPLKPAKSAVFIDNTDQTLEEVVVHCLNLCRQALANSTALT